MQDNKKIDNLIEEKLRGAKITKTSPNFTELLMKRVAAEHKTAMEESKWDKLVKYIIGSFSLGIIGFTVALAFISGSSSTGNNPATTGVNLGPAMETSNNYFERFISGIESVFLGILNFLGLSANPKTFTIIFAIVLVIGIFLAAERFVLRNRLRSSSLTVK